MDKLRFRYLMLEKFVGEEKHFRLWKVMIFR